MNKVNGVKDFFFWKGVNRDIWKVETRLTPF